MNALVKLPKVRNNGIHVLRKFYDGINRIYATGHHLKSKQAPIAR